MNEPRIYLDDPDFRLWHGDVSESLQQMPEQSVHVVVTSPPYFNLRDYGTGLWEGGDEGCDHAKPVTNMNASFNERWGQGAGERKQERKSEQQYAGECPKCGAVRIDKQLGLESTVEEYVARMVEVFREVRRVLRDDGTVWLNLGDSYVSVPGSQKQGENGEMADRTVVKARAQVKDTKAATGAIAKRPPSVQGLPPKNLIGVPWKVAFALQEDGWILRSDVIEEVEFYCPCGCGHVLEERVWRYGQDGDVIWKKPNAMPESTKDRPAKTHEYIFMLTKKPRYFYDRYAVLEPYEMKPQRRLTPREDNPHAKVHGQPAHRRPEGGTGGWQPPQTETLDPSLPPEAPRGMDGRRKTAVKAGDDSIQHRDGERWPNPDGRNLRSVWSIVTEPFKGAHFAVMPSKLVRTCILASTSEKGCCPECGAPWERIVESESSWEERKQAGATRGNVAFGDRVGAGTQRGVHGAGVSHDLNAKERRTLGWQPTCEHGDLPPVPAVCMDPFMGSGTVALVARKLGRHAVGIELNDEFCEMIAQRTQQQSLLTEEIA